jgi:Cu2+-containing amine oxidase
VANWGDFHQVSGAGWSVWWRISALDGSGLEVWWADFAGKRVLWRGTQPFAIVPYHQPVPFPNPPNFAFKDGINPQWDGAAFTALKTNAPNSIEPRSNPAWWAANDTEAVQVDIEPATSFGPAVLRITAKFQCGWYQYVHRWEFSGDGVIEPNIALGGALNPYAPAAPHVHHMYFRIDLDIDGFSSDVFEVFEHTSFAIAGGDQWTLQSSQGKHTVDLATARKFRVRDLVSKSSKGAPRGYEIEIPQGAGPDSRGTGDVWATLYRGDSAQQGAEVGQNPNCDDRELEQLYANGQLDTANGSDIVLWVAVRHHHEPRDTAEEAVFLPYHYAHFAIVPRGFEVFDREHGHPG